MSETTQIARITYDAKDARELSNLLKFMYKIHEFGRFRTTEYGTLEFRFMDDSHVCMIDGSLPHVEAEPGTAFDIKLRPVIDALVGVKGPVKVQITAPGDMMLHTADSVKRVANCIWEPTYCWVPLPTQATGGVDLSAHWMIPSKKWRRLVTNMHKIGAGEVTFGHDGIWTVGALHKGHGYWKSCHLVDSEIPGDGIPSDFMSVYDSKYLHYTRYMCTMTDKVFFESGRVLRMSWPWTKHLSASVMFWLAPRRND